MLEGLDDRSIIQTPRYQDRFAIFVQATPGTVIYIALTTDSTMVTAPMSLGSIMLRIPPSLNPFLLKSAPSQRFPSHRAFFTAE